MRSRMIKAGLSLCLFLVLVTAPATASANNPAATAAGLAIDAVIVGLQAAIAADQPIAGGQAGSGAARTAEEAGDKVISPIFVTVIRQVGLNLLSFVMDRLAYDAAVALSSAGTAQTPLVYFENPEVYWKQLGMDIVGETISSLDDALSSSLNQEFNLCAPEDPLARLSLQIGLRSAYSRQSVAPRCEFQDFLKNINAIGARYAGEEGGTQNILRQFANAWRPGQNELSASIVLSLGVHQEVYSTKTIGLEERFASQGFKDVVDVITGQIKTPSALIQEQSARALIWAKNERLSDLTVELLASGDGEALKQMGLSALSIFANTLLSNLANNIFSGLFNPPDISGLDPFNPQASILSGRERAEETFRSILAAPIISFDDYNILSEFVVCPGDDLRGLNSCVMDQNLASAVSRAGTGAALTVQQAIDEGYLHGDWPLIPESDEGRNQDLRCYTYGYCYGNLVKMRKARILPIGWELAANAPWNDEASPATLQTVVDGFHGCNDQGQADDTNKWCHLIDPNWILKVPPAQCRAFVPSELPVSGLVNARQSVCVDSPTCIEQNENGECVGGYGYCTEETNTWQFRGDSCPAEYAGCLAFNQVRTGETGTWLLNTVNTDGCSADNSGCRWYRTNQYEDDKGTPELTDDTFEFLPTGETYVVALRDDDIGLGSLNAPASYEYDTGGDGLPDFSYENYAFEDRLYVNQNIGTCSAEAAGCTELISADNARLNLLRNPSFEDDEDEDGVPDGWEELATTTFPDAYDTTSGAGFNGSDAVTNDASAISFTQEGIALSPNRFYTLSFYVNTVTASFSPARAASIELVPQTGTTTISLLGTTVFGDCSVSAANPDTLNVTIATSAGGGYVRKTCTFTTPSVPTYAGLIFVDTSGASDETYYDAFQLELGSLAGTFQEGYGTGLITREYLTVPPAWMGCTGAASDPAECASYTRVCSAQDVGCDLYTPTAGGFGVPAVTSAVDSCPSECVGYETYKQEATPYEAEAFPLFFIADSARSCSQAEVGCDAYTNLNEVALGGEGVEHYSTLRFCAQPSQDSGSTFYTWEGTEDEGFQLRAWQLLESNMNDARDTVYIEGTTTVFSEIGTGLAPCTNSVVTSENTVACQDVVRDTTETDTYTDCNEHADTITNPDCREFYDSVGNIHYRLLSETAVISDTCAPYRKDAVAGSGEDLDGDGIDDGEENCEGSGGFWTAGGACRYFVLANESNACSEAAAGCRAYTGGSGRNASTIFVDTVEDGTLNEYTSASPATISNESIAAGGTSIRVTGATVNTLSLVEGTATISLGDTNTNGQCDTGEICTLTEGPGGSSCQVTGTDTNNIDDCGPMVGQLAEGKTYILEFWAKGIGVVTPQFVANRGTGTIWDLGDATAVPPANSVTLSAGWQLYSIGPFDTSDETLFTDFDDTALLRFSATGSPDYFIDNIVLKETEENLALIKDSWVTPSTCDLSPTGTPSPQHYLGCQEYTDGAGTEQNLYQFTRLCSEEVIGCRAYFDTQNSELIFTQVFNATCSRPVGVAPPVGAEACTMNGVTVCTIASGRTSCHFDYEGTLPNPLPSSSDVPPAPFNVTLGPEAQVVPGDSDTFLVNKGTTSCGAAMAGCTEVGLPTFNQEKSAVTEFESTYLIDDPDRYLTTLCDTEGLFCEAWSTLADGTFYFKDPENQTCDYKPNVTINSQAYSGWFRTGTTNTPCYYTDDGDGLFEPATELASAYLISGIEVGIWRNGDEEYDGWLATCPSRYDRCSEFVDPMDTQDGLYPNGTPYVYLKNDKIEESRQSTSERCNGEVNLNEGCALFFDSVQPELLWNASASYIASEHADTLFGDAPQSSQSPVSCFGAIADNPLTTTIDEGNDVGRILSPSGVEFNVCQSRCRYEPEDDGVIEHPYARRLGSGTTYTTSCMEDSDCSTLKDSNNNSVTGECRQAYEDDESGLQPEYDSGLYTFILDFDDVNDVRRVERDRQCSEWLTCKSTIQVWDERTGRFREICDQIGACNQYAQNGDTTLCVSFSDEPVTQLEITGYVDRDISWWGSEYSGYSIPGNFPTEALSQININPPRHCNTDGPGEFTPCTIANEATICGAPGSCIPAPEDYRLAFQAGTCDSLSTSPGGACYIGTCADTGFRCATDDDCGTIDNPGELCEIGRCELTDTSSFCEDNDDCSGSFTCQGNRCRESTSVLCSPSDPTACAAIAPLSGQCIPEDTSYTGTCYADKCLLSVDAQPFSPLLNAENQNAIECRGYPEQNSPYPHAIVTSWTDQAGNLETDPDVFASPKEATPYTKKTGYQGVQACAPNSEDCQCTYKKVSYGNGVGVRYYDDEQSEGDFLLGVCSGGNYAGRECFNDAACNCVTVGPDLTCTSVVESPALGRCVKVTSVETMLGLPGYCLERDSAINKFADANNVYGGICETWLPVDQLIGTGDLYNNFTGAGFPIQNTFACTEVTAYVDLFPPGSTNFDDPAANTIIPSCAESQSASSGGTCSEGETNNCGQNAHCPFGFFAVVGYCMDSDLLAAGVSDCQEDGSRDNNCPYICIPFGSTKATNGDACEPPASNPNGVTSGLGPSWSTPYYYVGSNFLDQRNGYASCVRRGVSVAENIYAGTNASGTPLTEGPYQRITPIAIQSASQGYYSAGVSDQPYLGCSELALISTPEVDLGGPKNKAWTNRIWEGAQVYDPATDSYVDDPYSLFGVLNFLPTTDPTSPHGIIEPEVLTLVGDSASGFELELNEALALNDTIPAPIKATRNGNELLTANEGDSASEYPASINLLGHGYQPYSPVLPFTGSGISCPLPEDPVSAFPAGCQDPSVSCNYTTTVPNDNDCLLRCSSNGNDDCYYDADNDPNTGNSGGYEYFGPCETFESNDSISSSVCATPVLTSNGCSSYNSAQRFTAATTTQQGVCQGATSLAGEYCQLDIDCYDTACVVGPGGEGQCLNLSSVTTPFTDLAPEETSQNAFTQRLAQVFGKVFAIFEYFAGHDGPADSSTGPNGTGRYVKQTSNLSSPDVTADPDVQNTSVTSGDEHFGGAAPVIRALGDCFSGGCREGDDDSFSVNGVDAGTILGANGSAHASVQFFAEANSNQLPIKNVYVNWGDGWQSGNASPSSYYKNRRGLHEESLNNQTESFCALGRDWGETNNACQPNYFTFTHDYVCNETALNILPECGSGQDESDGCKVGGDTCVFVPRVQVKDNWGYCTGECGDATGPSSRAGTQCYDDDLTGRNECETVCDQFASDLDCSAGLSQSNIVDPWIYFNGEVQVES